MVGNEKNTLDIIQSVSQEKGAAAHEVKGTAAAVAYMHVSLIICRCHLHYSVRKELLQGDEKFKR